MVLPLERERLARTLDLSPVASRLGLRPCQTVVVLPMLGTQLRLAEIASFSGKSIQSRERFAYRPL